MASKKVVHNVPQTNEDGTPKYTPKKKRYSREQILGGVVVVIMALSALIRIISPFLRLR
jgi:hypothetical protein